jgi:hypothetical protein
MIAWVKTTLTGERESKHEIAWAEFWTLDMGVLACAMQIIVLETKTA